MKITHLIKNLVHQHEEIIRLIDNLDEFLNKSISDDPIDMAFDTINSPGCKGLYITKKGKVVRQQPQGFFPDRLPEFREGIYEDIKLAWNSMVLKNG